jgi:NAD(P)-dependent dehydrogenase (short-subunit alcohol dehydrogenase family)
MNMQNLNGKRVVVTGGSQGLGLAMVEALVASGANVTAMSRDRSNLAAAEEVGASVIAGDATDATLMNAVVRDETPAYFVALDFVGDRVVSVHDFLYARYAMDGIDLSLLSPEPQSR